MAVLLVALGGLGLELIASALGHSMSFWNAAQAGVGFYFLFGRLIEETVR
jgi:hypothetical protein